MATEDFTDSALEVYPNPSANVVYVQSKEYLTDYQISNMLGQVVPKGSLLRGENAISIAGLVTGTYSINFKTIEGTDLSPKDPKGIKKGYKTKSNQELTGNLFGLYSKPESD